jgi:predicted RNase H-like HicB family nuclease
MDNREPDNIAGVQGLRFQFELGRESDGRWIAEIPEIPGAMAYGATVEEAKAKAYKLALYAVSAKS